MTTDACVMANAIAGLERRLGAELPADYREYQYKGRPWDDRCRTVSYRLSNGQMRLADVRRPYDLVPGTATSRLGDVELPTVDFILSVMEQRSPGDGLVPRDAIVVASCESLEVILLFVKSVRRAQVWLKEWSGLEDEGVDEPEDGLHFLASSFADFLVLLRPDG